MLQRDYFIRLIEEFNAAVSRFLEKRKDNKDDELRDLYRQYVGDYELLRNGSLDEIMTFSHEQWGDDVRMEKINMLAELLYVEGSYQQNPLRTMLLEKAYRLYDYVEANGDVFSIARRQKMQQLRKELGKL